MDEAFATCCAATAAFFILWIVKIVNRNDDWIHAAPFFARATIAIVAALALTMLAALCLHLFIHS
jgi:hypothetical protein